MNENASELKASSKCSEKLKSKLKSILKDRLERTAGADNIAFQEKRPNSNEYHPYVLCVNDNLIKNLELTCYLNGYYSMSDINDMRALRSSSALTYNTFSMIDRKRPLIIFDTVYEAFHPEERNRPLKNRRPSQIDGLFKSEESTLMLEMKMFEHYDHRCSDDIYENKKSVLKSSFKSYLEEENYESHYAKEFIDLFKKIMHEIKQKTFEKYDIVQMAKHLLSIINNRDEEHFKNKSVLLLSVSWLASRTSLIDELESEADKRHLKACDDNIEQEAKHAVKMLNDFLDDLGVDDISVAFMDYAEFVSRSNLAEHPHYDYLKARYL